MAWWQALILGVVEGLTEYLPVSSTGHLILTAWLLGFDPADQQRWQDAFTFSIVIQAGAILAVLGLYRHRAVQIGRGLAGGDPAGRRLALNLFLAFLPAAVLGPLLHHRIEQHLAGPWPVVVALFLGAWLMLLVAKSRRIHGETPEDPQRGRTIESIQPSMALLIGFGQCLAMWPGTSRSMITIVAALLLGLRAAHAAEFSFLLGVITLTAATAFKAWQGGPQMLASFGALPVAVGMIAATVSAALAVKWFVRFLNRYGLAPFGWYRLALATVFALLILMGVLHVPG